MFMATGYVLTQFLLGILVPLCIRRRSLVKRIIRLDLGGARTVGKLTLLKVRSCPSNMQRATILPGHESFDFTVSNDVAAPTVSAVAPKGTTISPFTTLTLTMSEAAMKGTGSLILAPVETPGHSVALASCRCDHHGQHGVLRNACWSESD